ncbi:MAG: serine/threonine-protein kinase [Magnetospirillum sp.]|nr:serine/threonine-protein kinase [Magnetospirillum sp.]
MDTIGKYAIRKAAVTSGYAQVLFCHDPDLLVPVAVKLFDPRRLQDGPLSPGQLLTRFLAEARTLAVFDHPHVVGIKTFERFRDGRPYFVMPYLAAHLPYEIGKDIAAPQAAETAPERDRPRRVGLARAIAILKQLALALAALHRRGMVHRWVKPSNILLTAREGGNVRLADFSMVKLPDGKLPMCDHWPADSGYAAPEQRENAAAVGPQADVYSLGVLACRLLTGRLPDAPGSAAALLDKESETLSALIARMTDPDPAARPAHAGALLPLLDSVPVPNRPVRTVVHTAAPRRAAAAAGA